MTFIKHNYLLVNLTWTEEEKKQLLEALQTYGVGDITKLAAAIPTKTRGEVKYAMGLYSKRAKQILKKDTKKGEARNAPIDLWLQYLKRKTPASRKAAKCTATALKFLALYEKRFAMDDVVLRDCYEYLSEVTLGRPPKKINHESLHFLMTNFRDLAMDLQQEDRSQPMQFIKNLKTADIAEKSDASKKGTTVRNPTLNVLNVPPELLHLMKQE